MIYVFPLIIPASTPASAPLIVPCQLSSGTIVAGQFQFPGGPLGLAHVYVRNGLNQVWPANPEQDFATDNETIEWEDEYPLLNPPFQLQAYGYNLDTLNPHTITLRVVILPQVSPSQIASQVQLLLGASGG